MARVTAEEWKLVKLLIIVVQRLRGPITSNAVHFTLRPLLAVCPVLAQRTARMTTSELGQLLDRCCGVPVPLSHAIEAVIVKSSTRQRDGRVWTLVWRARLPPAKGLAKDETDEV